MFETKEQREKRERSEAADRQARIREYEKKMGVELPYSPVAVVERKPETPTKPVVAPIASDKPERGLATKNKLQSSRATYMAGYRKRPGCLPEVRA